MIENQEILNKIIRLIESCDVDNIELAYQIGLGAETYIPNFNIEKFLISHYEWLNVQYNHPITFIKLLKNTFNRTSLTYNNRSVLPHNLGCLKYLTTLNISKFDSTVLPKCVTDCVGLEYLSIKDSNLSDLTDNIGNLINLKNLVLENCNITSFPKSIEKLENLFGIELQGNPISYEECEKLQILLPETIIWLPSFY